ncbi:FeoC-like transcriptional regulator [Thaumasiovibrio subtropicus]|uniref:FeoC-like transcriptional regulator n=1 Tax=Thaumasiovibrio subtropicus TaxID=1891207 RepID=UPI000B362EBF|nr:FeoC-like transcriptional regulator [Thaumasiovibrio subtropicus]
MILQSLKAYLIEQGRVERAVIARKFALSQDGVDAMLVIWQKRGKIKQEIVGGQSCLDAKQVWYQWISGDELAITQLS